MRGVTEEHIGCVIVSVEMNVKWEGKNFGMVIQHNVNDVKLDKLVQTQSMGTQRVGIKRRRELIDHGNV